MVFRKTRPGKMGILTIPQGTALHRRKDERSERAVKEFDVLAMPSRAGAGDGMRPAYSFKMRDDYWYVLAEDIPDDDND